MDNVSLQVIIREASLREAPATARHTLRIAGQNVGPHHEFCSFVSVVMADLALPSQNIGEPFSKAPLLDRILLYNNNAQLRVGNTWLHA